MGFFVFVNFFALRNCLNVAIIVMVNSTYLRQLDGAAAANVSINSSCEHEPRASDHSSSTHYDNNVRIQRI